MSMPELTAAQKDSIYLVSGRTHEQLAEDTANSLGIELGPIKHKTFANTEVWNRYEDSVRGKHVFIMQSMAAVAGRSINDSFVEACLMIDAAKRASAKEITMVAPHLAYARQDRKNQGRDPISAAWAVHTLVDSGADRLVAVDMHSPQAQGVHLGPFDHLTAFGLMRDALSDEIGDRQEEFIVVSPDSGRVKASEQYAKALGVDMTFMPKIREREDPSIIRRPKTMGEIAGRTCIVTDDMIDTAGTLVSAVDSLYGSGAERVIVGATHGVFSDKALERLDESAIDKMFVTDTIPQQPAIDALGDRLTVLSVGPMLAEAINAISTGGSVSDIFEGNNYS